MRFHIIWSVAGILLVSSLTFAQATKLALDKPIGEQIFRKPPTPATAVALEGAVDPEQYILGPNDRLQFGAWGSVEISEELTVSPDGYLAIPGVGLVRVANLTLNQAIQEVRERAAKSYAHSMVTLQLIGIRYMRASVGGAVTDPGVYDLTAVDRLSNLILLAGGLYEPEPSKPESVPSRKPVQLEGAGEEEARADSLKWKPEMPELLPSLRHIRITDREGTPREVDYLRFQRSGDLRFNPVLRDGDAVYIPPLEREVGVLRIFGAVKGPGEYEYVRGDHLRDLIEIAGGLRSDADLANIVVLRFERDGKRSSMIPVSLKDDAEDRGPPLEADDRVFIRMLPDYRKKFHVEIRGEAVYTGEYAIEESGTRLSELLTRAGGITEYADLSNARLIRKGRMAHEDLEYERLFGMNVGDMSDFEYAYFKDRAREADMLVVVDFEKLLENGDGDVQLQDGDLIDIPRLVPTVKVTGQVRESGIVGYKPGMDYHYYLEQAGGFAWNAQKGKMRLIKARTGRWEKLTGSSNIEAGDTIFIPEKKEIDYWELSKDMLLVISQVATIFVVARSVR